MTDQELKDLVASLAVKSDRLDEQMKNTFAEIHKANAELREAQRQTDEQMKKTDEQMKKTDEQMKKTDEKIDRLGQRFGDFGNNRGEEVEEFFYRYFAKHPQLLGISFDEVDRNIQTSDGSEHDIILVNGKVAALISVKFKLHKQDIDKLVSTELKQVQHFFHKLGSQHRLYGGVASYIVNNDVKKYAEEQGLYVITRSGDNTIFLNQEGFAAKAF